MFPDVLRDVRSRALLAAVAVGLALAATAPAAATTRAWPGSAPCATTLQACIAGADAGDVVEIASNGPITESLEIFGKSLTLRAASGFLPVLQGGPFSDVIDAFGANSPVTIVIEGVTVRDGSITAYQGGSGAFDVTIRANTIEADGLDANRTAIRVSTFGADPSGPVTFSILDNKVDLGFLQGDDIAAIGVDELVGTTTGVIEGNTISRGGNWSTLSAIRVRNSAGEADVQLRRNRVAAAGYNGGILLMQDAAGGVLTAHVIDNLVTGTVGVTGPQPAAVSLLASAGTLHASVLSNTLVGNDAGFITSAGAGAALEGVLANNVIVDNTSHGVVVPSALAADFSNEHNLVFGNGTDDFAPGVGTVQADPAFVAATDYRLRANSPARDAGNTALALGIATDIDGAARIFGGAVDIGAWEIGDAIFADGFDG